MTKEFYSKLLIAIVAASIIAAIIIIKKRRAIVSFFKAKKWSSGILLAAILGFPFFSTIVAAWSEVWKSGALTNHPIRTPYAAHLLLVLFGSLYAANWFRDALKDQLSIRILELENESTRLREERDRWLHLVAQIRTLIDRKMDATLALAAKKEKITPTQFIHAWDRELHIHTILQGIHSFFHFELKKKRRVAQLRLALYTQDREKGRLELGYSWNGLKADCVTEHPERMEVGSAEGVASLIVQTFCLLGDHKLSVVADTWADRQFYFFSPQQRDYLRSMLAFKYQVMLDGTKSAVVLALDTDEPGFFSEERATEFSAFLVDMMRRFEYEVLTLDLTKQVETK